MNALEQQVFHLAKNRPKETVAKFNTDNANSVFDWIQENLQDFLDQLEPELRSLYDEAKSDPAHDNGLFLSMGPTLAGGPPLACTASPIESYG
jgi:hypothetical protein